MKLTSRLTKQDLGKLIKFITGHGPFKSHMAVCDNTINDTLCRLCLEAEENPLHLYCECPALVTARKSRGLPDYPAVPYFGDEPDDSEQTLENLIAFVTMKDLDDIYSSSDGNH